MTKPLDTQIGGDHYKSLPIQPMEYSMLNGLDACQHTIIKYVTRFREKGGIEDLHKARHCIDMLIEFETEYGQMDAGWTPEAIDAAKLPDWDAAEARMDAIGQNGPDGAVYTHDLTPYIHHAPAWADELFQPIGSHSIYARNKDGRDKLLDVQADHAALFEQTLDLPPSRRFVCCDNKGAESQLTVGSAYRTRTPADEFMLMIAGDDGEIAAFNRCRFV